MVKIEMNFDPNLGNVNNDFSILPDAIMLLTADAIEQTALDVKADVSGEMFQAWPQGVASDRKLKQSVEVDEFRELSNGFVRYTVGTTVPYAHHIEYGTNPHSATTGDYNNNNRLVQ